jgi:hypothetical protein
MAPEFDPGEAMTVFEPPGAGDGEVFAEVARADGAFELRWQRVARELTPQGNLRSD